MRLYTLGWILGLVGVGAIGCTIVQADNEEENNGVAGTGGQVEASGGSSGTAGAAAAPGSGGTPAEGGTAGNSTTDPCQGVSVNGECLNETTIRTCLITDGLGNTDSAQVVESTCPSGRACKVGPSGAYCALVGACSPGDVQCSYDGLSVRNCSGTGQNTTWVDTPCDINAGEKCNPGSPGSPAACVYVPSSSGSPGTTLEGRIRYEYRPVRADGMGWDNIKIQDAVDLYVTVYDDGEFIGAGMSGWDSVNQSLTGDGSFVAKLQREMKGPTEVWAWPIVFNYATGQPAMAVVKLKNTEVIENARQANEYWAWGLDITPGTTNMGTWTIGEKDYSGALHIFSWIDYALLRTADTIPGDQMSVAVFWDPKVGTPSCGACFCGPGCGGAQLQYGSTPEETDYYDSWIALGGPPDDGSTEWSRAVISHEIGHWTMHNYSISPGEGGQHYVNSASKPGLAYSEAWATAFGCSGIESPMYVDEQSGTFFWVDISKYTYSGGKLTMPDPKGPIDQYINENMGAGMIWKLFVDQSMDPDGRNLGDPKVFGALTYPPLVNGTFNRGYQTVDLIDFFDAAICSGNASVADIDAVTKTTGFPYNPATRPCQ